MAKNISETKISNIKKLRELGYSVAKIAKMTGVSKVTVFDYTTPGHYDKRRKASTDYYRRTRVSTTSADGKLVIIDGLSKREYSEVCELCGSTGKRMYYHFWDDEDPSLGLWLCYACRVFASLIDKFESPGIQSLVSRYEQMKTQLEADSKSNISHQGKQTLWITE